MKMPSCCLLVWCDWLGRLTTNPVSLSSVQVNIIHCAFLVNKPNNLNLLLWVLANLYDK